MVDFSSLLPCRVADKASYESALKFTQENGYEPPFACTKEHEELPSGGFWRFWAFKKEGDE